MSLWGGGCSRCTEYVHSHTMAVGWTGVILVLPMIIGSRFSPGTCQILPEKNDSRRVQPTVGTNFVVLNPVPLDIEAKLPTKLPFPMSTRPSRVSSCGLLHIQSLE